MTPQRRWIQQIIETAKGDKTPMPWTMARRTRPIQATKTAIRTTLRPKHV